MGQLTTPVRIDSELYVAAACAAKVMSRSATQQIAHWARIGRELEASADVSVDQVAAVLSRQTSYDALKTEEQAVARAFWAQRMEALLSVLDLERDFSATGRPFVELDASGAVTRRDPAARRVDTSVTS